MMKWWNTENIRFRLGVKVKMERIANSPNVVVKTNPWIREDPDEGEPRKEEIAEKLVEQRPE